MKLVHPMTRPHACETAIDGTEHPITRAHDAGTRDGQECVSEPFSPPNLNPAVPGICAGKTLSGASCGQKLVYANGRCYAHGGAPTEESIAAILKRHAERLKERQAKRNRRLARQARRVASARALLRRLGKGLGDE